MNVDARIEALEEQNEELRERILMLEDAFGMRSLTPIEWRLTGKESRVFGVLLARDIASKTAIMAGLYDVGENHEPEIKIVDVFVCKMRKKLAPFGIAIETRWGEGYFLTAETKAKARQSMGPQPTEQERAA